MTPIVSEASKMPPATEAQRPPTADTAPTTICTALNNQCRSHQQDYDDLIHRGPEYSIFAGENAGFLPAQLVQWGDDEPRLQFGRDCAELNVAGVEALLAEVDAYTKALLRSHRHLVAAVDRHRLDSGVPLAEVRAAWTRVRVNHDPRMPSGSFSCASANRFRALDTVHYNQDATTPAELDAYLTDTFGNHVAYTSVVADVLDGFEAVRQADDDPKIVAFWDEVEQLVIASDDPKACFARLAEIVSTENAGQVTA